MLAFTLVTLAAATQGTSEPTARDSATLDPNKKICRQYGAATGSRFGSRRICKTQAEWNLMGEDKREQMDRMQRSSVGRQGQ